MTSPPASRISSSRLPVTVPKWITGTALPIASMMVAGVRQDEAPIIIGAETADPAIEELDRVSAGGDLHAQVVGGDGGNHRHHAMPDIGRGVHQGFGRLILARGAALDQI